MKKLIVMGALLLVSAMSLYAQDTAELSDSELRDAAKARKEVVRQTKKEIESKCLKDAKKQAKTLKKAGWKPAIGTAPLEKQLSDYLMRHYEKSSGYPTYITAQSNSVSGAYSTARKAAELRARTAIASSMRAEVCELAEDAHKNNEIDANDVETITGFMSTSKQLVQQTMGRTDVVLDIYRELEDGRTEAWVGVSYDGSRARADILKAFENESAEIRSRMEQMLSK